MSLQKYINEQLNEMTNGDIGLRLWANADKQINDFVKFAKKNNADRDILLDLTQAQLFLSKAIKKLKESKNIAMS
jgi:hypothetical protein